MNQSKIAELELKILGVLWSLSSGGSVKEILAAWSDSPAPGYTTVLKKLQIMEEKGFVRHEPQGKNYRYYPLLSREEVTKSKIKDLSQTIFSGDRIGMTAAFLKQGEFDEQELSAIKEMIEEMQNE